MAEPAERAERWLVHDQEDFSQLFVIVDAGREVGTICLTQGEDCRVAVFSADFASPVAMTVVESRLSVSH